MRVSGWAKTPALPTTDAYLPAKLQAAPPREGPATAPKNSSFSWLARHTRGRANCFPRGHAAVEDRLRPVLEQKRLLPLSRVQATMTPEACILLQTTIFSSTFQKGYNGTAAPAAVPTGSSRVPEYWSVRYLRNHPCGPSPDQSVTISRRIPSTSKLLQRTPGGDPARVQVLRLGDVCLPSRLRPACKHVFHMLAGAEPGHCSSSSNLKAGAAASFTARAPAWAAASPSPFLYLSVHTPNRTESIAQRNPNSFYCFLVALWA